MKIIEFRWTKDKSVEGGYSLKCEARVAGTDMARVADTGDLAIGRLVTDYAKELGMELQYVKTPETEDKYNWHFAQRPEEEIGSEPTSEDL